MSAGSAGTRADFLVEIGTEELPPLALPELERVFAAGIHAGLAEAGLEFRDSSSFATPRRLAVLVRALAAQQPAQTVKLKGPPVSAAFGKDGAPTAAAVKFAQKCGVGVDALTRITEGKGEFLFYSGSKPGVATAALLPAIVQKSLDALPIPKRMRWGSSNAEFVRPVHWLVLMFGGDVIPARILDTASGRTTRGHRFMAPGELTLAQPAEYERTLHEQGKVIASFAARREKIRGQVDAAAKSIDATAVRDDELLDEVAALVEWPSPVIGRFEERFLELPREVLISTLQEHQRYFPVMDEGQDLVARFITISNIESRDPEKVIAGNERVVRPRLSDGAFFWSQDRKSPLAARLPGLDAVTFQAKLGSIGDKVRRVRKLAGEIALIIDAPREHAERAADLAKCDLLTLMVGEFPELQGTMGRYYAEADGEPVEVSQAIEEHYLPRGGGGLLPHSSVGVAVALADKLDTLAGIFSIGQKPSGTKDPFGLRRAAIGVLRTLVEVLANRDIDLRELIRRACELQPVKPPGVEAEIWEYVLERLRAYLLDAQSARGVAGATAEMFDAVRASDSPIPVDIANRLSALVGFLKLPEAASLTAANKRISNILRKSELGPAGMVDGSLLREPAERTLHAAVDGLAADVEQAVKRREYQKALTRLATLRPSVDAFFDAVMVNTDDAALRRNRLALLGQLRGLFARIADLSCLPG